MQNMKPTLLESLDTAAPPTSIQSWLREPDFPKRAFITSDGVQLSYIRRGSGRPVVLVHGWSQDAEEFTNQIDPLSTRYDVIAFAKRSDAESQKAAYRLTIS